MGFAKGVKPPRYDKAFKDGTVKLVVGQGRGGKYVAKGLGISIGSLRNWLKLPGIQPSSADKGNPQNQRARGLEAQARELKKQLAEKEGTIVVLKRPPS